MQQSAPNKPGDCLIFLDAELYIDRVNAPEIVHNLQTTGGLPTATCVYLSHHDSAARHVDFACNETFSRFLATNLRRWIDQTIGPHQRTFLCGLSLSGLAAAFAALRHPTVFSGAVCQSPSAWWNDEWLAASLNLETPNPGRFWISAGDRETDAGVTHAPSGLHQKTSQLDSCRRLAQALTNSGTEVRYSEFSGGHDPACWAEELPQALKWLLQASDTA